MPSIRGQFLSLDQVDAEKSFFWKAASRAMLAALGAQYGWPLYGIFIAGGENVETPDYILERHSFPTPTGGGDLANKVQTAIDNDMQAVYKSKDADARYFWITCHIWNHQADKGQYMPRGNHVGDYNIYLGGQPPADWWQELN